jgi:PiT family inorganic phosphate transporter
MNVDVLLLGLAVLAGGYMAFNIGANDVANAMGTSVGSKALTFRQAILIAAVFEFAGAVLVGASVTSTVSKGIIKPTYFAAEPQLLMYGMLSALLAAGIWLQLATTFGLPVSTTHSIVGAILGFGIVAAGPRSANWGKVVQIVMSWVISPVGGAFVAYLTYSFIADRIINVPDPVRAVRRYTPYFSSMVIFILILSFIYKGLKNLHLNLPLGTALLYAGIGAVGCGLLSHYLLARFVSEKYETSASMVEQFAVVEGVFRYLQIMTACYVAFAHGANDVANAAGPLAAIISIHHTQTVAAAVEVPFWILVAGGVGIIVGLSTFGVRVMATIGGKITELTPSRGFAAEFAAATTVLVCSRLGMPISTTHTLVGSVIGVGLARGMSALNMRAVRGIINSWLVTLPFTVFLAILIYWTLLWMV